MIRLRIITACAGTAIVWTAAVVTAARPQTASASRIDYRRQIQPVIEKHCLECHNQDRRQGGLSLATYSDAVKPERSDGNDRLKLSPPRKLSSQQ